MPEQLTVGVMLVLPPQPVKQPGYRSGGRACSGGDDGHRDWGEGDDDLVAQRNRSLPGRGRR